MKRGEGRCATFYSSIYFCSVPFSVARAFEAVLPDCEFEAMVSSLALALSWRQHLTLPVSSDDAVDEIGKTRLRASTL